MLQAAQLKTINVGEVTLGLDEFTEPKLIL